MKRGAVTASKTLFQMTIYLHFEWLGFNKNSDDTLSCHFLFHIDIRRPTSPLLPSAMSLHILVSHPI